jgi:hypothetical protein
MSYQEFKSTLIDRIGSTEAVGIPLNIQSELFFKF